MSGCSEFLEADPAAVDASSPDAPAGLTPGPVPGAVTASDDDTRSVLTFAEPDDRGSPIIAYEYDVNADDTWRALGADRAVLGLSNGTSYRFRVRALNAHGPSATPSAQSNEVVPHGAPLPPTVDAAVGGETITWTWSATDGNGREIIGYRVKLDDAPYGAITAGEQLTQKFAWGERHELCVLAASNGAPGRDTSREQCKVAEVGFPTAVAQNDGPGFPRAVAGGTRYEREILDGQTYSITGACYTSTDIGSNNGWWYRMAGTGRWVGATNFNVQRNEFGAPRVDGGGGGCT